MEELRSTEILDKEIVSDAQKKAERIAAKAAEECKKIAASVEARVLEEISKTEDNLKVKLKNFERDLNASVPLEKSRFYVSYVQDSIVKNINEYLASVSEDKVIDVLVKRCNKIGFGNLKLKAFVYGLDEKKTEKALKKVLGTSLYTTEKTEFNKIIFEESVLAENKGIILISENEEVKCRFTLSQVVEEMLDKKRAELSESLFGKVSE